MSNIEPDKGNSEKRSLKLITSSKFSSLNSEKDTRIPDLSVVTMELKKWSITMTMTLVASLIQEYFEL